MDLWIRSQDKENLIKATGLRVLDNHIQMRAEGLGVLIIGTYATKKRALEVLEDIQNLLKPNCIIKTNFEGLKKDDASRIFKAYKKIFGDNCLLVDNELDFENINNVICYEMPKE